MDNKQSFKKEITVISLILMSFFSIELMTNIFLSKITFLSKSGLNGLISVIYVLITVLAVYFIDKNNIFNQIDEKYEKMTFLNFFKFLSVMFCLITIAAIPTKMFELILINTKKQTIMANENIKINHLSSTILGVLYSSFFAPIGEEIIFRGMILKNLKKYYSGAAIIISALLFGLYHGNFAQMLEATACGLILGYIALRFSLKWSIIMHIFYNFVFGELSGFVSKYISFSLPFVPGNFSVFSIVFFVLTAIGTFFIIKKFLFQKWPAQNLRASFKYIIYMLTSFGFIIFLMFSIMLGLSAISKI